MRRTRAIALWCALAGASCALGRSCRCTPVHDGESGRIQELDDSWEILPHQVIGPCTYQYDPPTKPWDGFVAVQIYEAAYPYYAVDKEKRILRITDCPDGGFPPSKEAKVDIVFEYDRPRSAQPEYYELSPDELDRKMFPRKPPR